MPTKTDGQQMFLSLTIETGGFDPHNRNRWQTGWRHALPILLFVLVAVLYPLLTDASLPISNFLGPSSQSSLSLRPWFWTLFYMRPLHGVASQQLSMIYQVMKRTISMGYLLDHDCPTVILTVLLMRQKIGCSLLLFTTYIKFSALFFPQSSTDG